MLDISWYYTFTEKRQKQLVASLKYLRVLEEMNEFTCFAEAYLRTLASQVRVIFCLQVSRFLIFKMGFFRRWQLRESKKIKPPSVLHDEEWKHS